MGDWIRLGFRSLPRKVVALLGAHLTVVLASTVGVTGVAVGLFLPPGGFSWRAARSSVKFTPPSAHGVPKFSRQHQPRSLAGARGSLGDSRDVSSDTPPPPGR